jgi:hypothetical protein
MIDALRIELAQVRQDKADRTELQAALSKTQRTVIVVGVASMAVHLMIQAFKTEHAKPTPISTGSQSVTVGAASPVSPQKEYLTTEEVAEKEGKTPRTIQDWCQTGRILGAEKRGKIYVIDPDYEVLKP